MTTLKPAADLFARLLFPRRQDAPAPRGRSLGRFQNIIGYRFRSKSLLRHALTHKSSIPAEDSQGLLSNERLEFLGDAVLSCIVTEHLYHAYPGQHEGELSKIKSLIVSRKILGELGQEIDIGNHLVFGISEERTGGRSRMSTMSNAFEALLGAMFLDGGYKPVQKFLRKMLLCRIEEMVEAVDNINYKSIILEKSQRDGFGMPRYVTLSVTGPDHAREFFIRIEVAGVPLGEGSGRNKKVAQQIAAQNALLNYNKEELLHHIHKGA